jgi:son of sevenless-like protein
MRQLNNYSGVMAFIAGFSNSAIARLRFTKNLVPKKNLEILESMEQLMNTASSFKVYREAVQTSNPPLIPYL